MSRTDTRTPSWRVVAEREVFTKLRDKAFIGGSIATLVIVLGAIILSAVLSGDPDEYDVVTTSESAVPVLEAAQPHLRAATGDDEATIDVEVVEDAAAAERLVEDGEADAALLPADDGGRFELVGDEEVDTGLAAAVSAAVSQAVLERNAAEQDVDLTGLYEGVEVGQRLLDPNAGENDARSGVAFAFALVFLFTALGFGMTIAQSVTMEKESRVVEILAAAVPVRALLWGKIIGNTVLAMGQVVLLVVAGVAALAATGQGDLLAGIGWAVAWYVVFFVLGFVALAALWSVAGSLASRQEDLQSTTLPGQFILFVPYFISVLASEEVRTVFSMLPIVSTMVMPGRMAEGAVPAWQVAVAIVVTVAAALVFVRVGSRLYERTLLRTGGKLGYREAWRLGG